MPLEQLDLLIPDDDQRPKGPALRKLYYSISEVSELIGVPQHVLRYWETEFSQISPKKAKGGTRLYQDKEIKLLTHIKTLLYEQKFTIAGAKTQLSQKSKRAEIELDLIGEVRATLHEILDLLDHKR